jgi:tRNA A37 threonylcarbamoyladenosine modification protein TsaB
VISLTSPLLIGIYKNKSLIDTYEGQEKTSEILPVYFNKILKKYDCKNLYYVNGPGSFMAIKITYLFLKTLSITKNLQLYATDGFTFNKNNPIKALGTLYFIKKDAKITTQKIVNVEKLDLRFNLPDTLDKSLFSTNNQPNYVLPAL